MNNYNKNIAKIKQNFSVFLEGKNPKKIFEIIFLVTVVILFIFFTINLSTASRDLSRIKNVMLGNETQITENDSKSIINEYQSMLHEVFREDTNKLQVFSQSKKNNIYEFKIGIYKEKSYTIHVHLNEQTKGIQKIIIPKELAALAVNDIKHIYIQESPEYWKIKNWVKNTSHTMSFLHETKSKEFENLSPYIEIYFPKDMNIQIEKNDNSITFINNDIIYRIIVKSMKKEYSQSKDAILHVETWFKNTEEFINSISEDSIFNKDYITTEIYIEGRPYPAIISIIDSESSTSAQSLLSLIIFIPEYNQEIYLFSSKQETENTYRSLEEVSPTEQKTSVTMNAIKTKIENHKLIMDLTELANKISLKIK